MAKRLFDLIVSVVALVLLSPILLFASLGIWLTSRGPLIYRANRVGRRGDLFVMHKFRTMHIRSGQGSVITAANDSRVFWVGKILRALKIDELPQLYDVLIGKMSLIGPRPADPQIVERYYGRLGRETLEVAPGLASPGSVYNYTHGHLYLDDRDPEETYVTKLLPIKLALELVYVRHNSLAYDLRIIGRTIVTILQIATGRREFDEPPEMVEALNILQDGRKDVINGYGEPTKDGVGNRR